MGTISILAGISSTTKIRRLAEYFSDDWRFAFLFASDLEETGPHNLQK